MKVQHQVIVDGYNVIRRTPALNALFHKQLAQSRDALAARCAAWRQARRDVAEVLIVFDGRAAVADLLSTPGGAGVRAIFTPRSETADQRIAELVRESGAARQLIVVSDDAEVVRQARACGAQVLAVREFLTPPRTRPGGPGAGASDDKVPTQEEGQINAWRRRELGLE